MEIFTGSSAVILATTLLSGYVARLFFIRHRRYKDFVVGVAAISGVFIYAGLYSLPPETQSVVLTGLMAGLGAVIGREATKRAEMNGELPEVLRPPLEPSKVTSPTAVAPSAAEPEFLMDSQEKSEKRLEPVHAATPAN
ncbi:hypothetical protein GTO89_06305 [Heliobacterium gestii]|uniref:Holin n=1 Tax=Heliomicrobium gestii TaxID=2699 RepID=A0A845LDE6_HELGE|nr:hypothetical protein [Heliomicrobium gestii]MBM7866018.1 hypothetical protein [Heliomicrobium gestii]MZP42649.1 hypothetical protein [Heliomicrobium gestii]